MNNHVTVLEIDSKALLHNLNFFKSKLQSKTKILAVVKAASYGSSSVLIANFLKDKVDYFAVAYAAEGAELRNIGIHTPILVLHPQIQNFEWIIENCLEPTLYSFKTLHAFLAIAKQKKVTNYPVHFKFNTGLNRLGFVNEDITELLSIINQQKELKVTSIFSHLAATEDLNERDFTITQINKFKVIFDAMQLGLGYKPMAHILNTSGVINYPEAHFDMVRVGIGLYGFANEEKHTNQLQNTHNLKTIISQIHHIKKGESVGYNRALIANQDMKTATIPIGHADGISRALGNKKGFVTINQQKAPIIGNVCMDMLMVDITEIDCEEGNEVIVYNNQQTIEELAKNSDTISYEILTAIAARVKKILI